VRRKKSTVSAAMNRFVSATVDIKPAVYILPSFIDLSKDNGEPIRYASPSNQGRMRELYTYNAIPLIRHLMYTREPLTRILHYGSARDLVMARRTQHRSRTTPTNNNSSRLEKKRCKDACMQARPVTVSISQSDEISP